MDADDGKVFDCVICGQVGNLLCCDNCPRAFHPKCVGGRQGINSTNWSCWECLIEDSARDGVRVPRVKTPMGPVWVIGGYVFRAAPPPSDGRNGGGKSWEEAAREAEEAEAAATEKAAAEGEKKKREKYDTKIGKYDTKIGLLCVFPGGFVHAVYIREGNKLLSWTWPEHERGRMYDEHRYVARLMHARIRFQLVRRKSLFFKGYARLIAHAWP